MEKSSISYGTVFAFLAFLQTFINTFLPREVQDVFRRIARKLFRGFSSYVELRIDEHDGVSTNELYTAVQLHLSQSAATAARKVKLELPKNASSPTYSLGEDERMQDSFQGVQVWWEFTSHERRQQNMSWESVPDDKRSLTLRMHRKDKDKILAPYVQHIIEHAEEVKFKSRDRMLHTNAKSPYGRGSKWSSVPFKHPSSFETLAMDSSLKQKIQEDLTEFVNGEAFYKSAGRAWKRGYLLYGPPGTGKSSMIAAIANFLHYDVYDLELTEVKSNAELRKLLIQTSNKSLIVIEDIDCSLDFSDRKKKGDNSDGKPPTPGNDGSEKEVSQVTLSGLLNFTDGLWSCCGTERIFVFTTNHIEKLDPALLRSGRMDMHVHMSYCTYEAFKVLARNYLAIEEHELYGEVEQALVGVEITPADVSEVLIREKKDAAEAMRSLVSALKDRKAKKELEASKELPTEEVTVKEFTCNNGVKEEASIKLGVEEKQELEDSKKEEVKEEVKKELEANKELPTEEVGVKEFTCNNDVKEEASIKLGVEVSNKQGNVEEMDKHASEELLDVNKEISNQQNAKLDSNKEAPTKQKDSLVIEEVDNCNDQEDKKQTTNKEPEEHVKTVSGRE